ncbi:hypothetical protein PoB_004273200 [Plakobranchus ocellatus]|uniref:Uncharacterized protein n=1 Tax=Plakobranchus ocellatus TaxID=259542 RepID=A0AAV4BAM8_9GAST|nr:hypothetical protein PoB_004273200 [Plakobranchus ocellatus]
MASTLLKLSVLLVCFSFVLPACLENEKFRLPNFLKVFGSKSEPTMEEQAENVVVENTIVSESADQLSREGKSLQRYGKSLQHLLGDEDEELKAFFDILEQVGDHVVRAGEAIKKTNTEINDALTNRMKDVGDVTKSSRKEVYELERFIEQSINDAGKALVKVFPKLPTRKQRKIARKLKEIDDMMQEVVDSLDEVGRDSVKLSQTVVKANKDIHVYKIFHRAGVEAVVGDADIKEDPMLLQVTLQVTPSMARGLTGSADTDLDDLELCHAAPFILWKSTDQFFLITVQGSHFGSLAKFQI